MSSNGKSVPPSAVTQTVETPDRPQIGAQRLRFLQLTHGSIRAKPPPQTTTGLASRPQQGETIRPTHRLSTEPLSVGTAMDHWCYYSCAGMASAMDNDRLQPRFPLGRQSFLFLPCRNFPSRGSQLPPSPVARSNGLLCALAVLPSGRNLANHPAIASEIPDFSH